MSAADVIFALVGLLLGLGMAEVLGGLSRVIVARRTEGATVRIGWLTPLIALFVIVDLLSFWLLAYDFRDQFRANFPMLIGVLAICGLYYLVTTLIFPADPTGWATLDDHYDRQRRVLVGGILGANFLQLAGQIAIEILVPAADTAETMSDAAMVLELLAAIGIVVSLIVLLVARSRTVNRAFLLIANLLVLVIGTITAGL